ISRGAFKVAENESPKPADRVFVNFDYLTGVRTFGGGPNFDVDREIIGFEKTFLDGDASFGFRVPLVHKDGVPAELDGFGDVSFLVKLLLLNDCSGNVFSTGLVVTAPSGRNVRLADLGTLHSALLQPWLGFLYRADRFYAHGFSAVVVPTEARDVTLL